MKFTMTFDIDSDVFHCKDGTFDTREIAHILRRAAMTISSTEKVCRFQKTVLEKNGQRIGEMMIIEDINP